ncbi:MAG: Xaa-Pro peptidase family protein [Chloroflexota bacterium]|nr:Xaa-Pro peptidase family protein [Chloroflexota bacterium]
MAIIEGWHDELVNRREKLWSIISDRGCDVALVYGSQEHSANFRYLTNFVPCMGDMWAVMTAADQMQCVLIFDWELDEARARSGTADWLGEFDPLPLVTDSIAVNNPKQVAVVGMGRIPAKAFSALTNSRPQVKFLDFDDSYSILRRRKSALEIRLLREAVSQTDEVLNFIRGKLLPGVSEHAIAAEILYNFRCKGITRLAFSPLVVSGNDHPVMVRDTTDRCLEIGDTVMIDIGAEYQGYQADVTRTSVLGKANDKQRHAWDTILEAHKTVLDLAKPGTPCRDLHRAAVDIFDRAGYPMRHRIGHGIGLATSFEWPSLDTESSPLLPGMTIAIEPGIYEPGAGSMKLEDSVLITEEGSEVLSTCSNDLIVQL